MFTSTMDKGILEYYSSGIVVEDKKPGDNTIKVFPEEKLADNTGVLTPKDEKKDDKASSKNRQGKKSNKDKLKIKKELIIEADWFPMDSHNRKSAPDVVKGMTVLIYKRRDADEFYWIKAGFETDLNGYETVLHAYSNTNKFGEKLNENNTYYTVTDTRNKIMKGHMSNNDGEVTTYDWIINGKKGIARLYDGKGNYIELDSNKGKWKIKAINEIELHAGKKVLIDAPIVISTGDTTVQKTLTVYKDTLLKAALNVIGKITGKSSLSTNGSISTNSSVNDKKGSITDRT